MTGADYSPTFLGPTSVLFALALLLSAARIYSRIRPTWRMAWDDYTILLALVSVIDAAEHRPVDSNDRGLAGFGWCLVRCDCCNVRIRPWHRKLPV